MIYPNSPCESPQAACARRPLASVDCYYGLCELPYFSPLSSYCSTPLYQKDVPPRKGMGRNLHRSSSELLAVPYGGHVHFLDHTVLSTIKMLRIYNQLLHSFLKKWVDFPKGSLVYWPAWGLHILGWGDEWWGGGEEPREVTLPPGDNTDARGAPVVQEGGRQGGRCRALWEEGSWAWCKGKKRYQRGCPCVRKKGEGGEIWLLVKTAWCWGRKMLWTNVQKSHWDVDREQCLLPFFPPHSTSPLFNEFICKGWSEGRLTSQ